jgi:formaldehyde-activating enzyme involved in methanogenesis
MAMVAMPAPRATVEEAACARPIWVEVEAAVIEAVAEAADTGASESGATPQSLPTQC